MACINPIEAYMIKITNAVNNGAYFVDAMESGFTGSTSVYCCPDCDGVYILTTPGQFFRYYDSMCGFDKTCCFNYKSTLQTYFDMVSNDVPTTGTCCTNFNSCVTDSLNVVIGCDEIDVFEYSTFDGEGSLCIVADVLSQYSRTTAANYLSTILDIGMVVICKDGEVICGTLDTIVFPYLNKTCGFYNMVESPEFINALTECNLYSSISATTISVNSFLINGVEQLTTPFTTTVDPNTVNWIPANNNIVSGCTSGSVTGITYTNMVDMMNDMFTTLGLSEYSAQIALDTNIYVTGASQCGFYLITPIGDDFEINVTSSISSGADITYTRTNVVGNNSAGLLYYGMTPSGFNYDCLNNVVIE
jgi:hypothetical protein